MSDFMYNTDLELLAMVIGILSETNGRDTSDDTNIHDAICNLKDIYNDYFVKSDNVDIVSFVIERQGLTQSFSIEDYNGDYDNFMDDFKVFKENGVIKQIHYKDGVAFC